MLIDVSKLSDVTDYFLICSADSARGVKTIVEHIEKTLSEHGEKTIGVEGTGEGTWVLIDAVDVVVHVFYHSIRDFYDIEGLWMDAPKVDLNFLENERASTQA